MQDLLVAGALFVAAFLLGSIPFGLIISKVFYHTDIREHGSGNIGTTNAIRTMGKVGGYSVFVLDFGKGLFVGRASLGVLVVPAAGRRQEPGSLVSYDTMLTVAFLGCDMGAYLQPLAQSSRAARASRWPWAACSSCSAGWAHGSSLPSSSCWWLPRSTCRSARSRRRWPARSSPCTTSGAIGPRSLCAR